jgi:hypothetical protein
MLNQKKSKGGKIVGKSLIEEVVGKDRQSIDLTGLRERIEGARSDHMWKELPMTKKVRLLLLEALDRYESKGSQ